MKYLLLIPLFVIGCGGELPTNCADGILQDDEICEMGMEANCHDMGYMSGTATCDDCHGWDVTMCARRNDD